MKSSTLRRANLSKEKIQVLETLAKYRRQQMSNNNTSNGEVQPIKERELDMLWTNFKQHQKQDKSPTVYLITGIIIGAIGMLIIVALMSWSMKSINETATDLTTNADTKIEDTAITFIPADKSSNTSATPVATTEQKPTGGSNSESYSVQSGDTLESIIIRFYGSYSKTHEKAILEANHMKNPNSLSIGQKLIIPLH